MQLGAYYLNKSNGLTFASIDAEFRACRVCGAQWIDICRLDSGALSGLPAEADALIMSPGQSWTGAHYARVESLAGFLPTRSIGRKTSAYDRNITWTSQFGYVLADAILLQRVTSTTPEMAHASHARIVAAFAADHPRKHDRVLVALERDKHGGKINHHTLPLKEVVCHHCYYGLILSEGNHLGDIAYRAYEHGGLTGLCETPRLGSHQPGVTMSWLGPFQHRDFAVSGEGYVYDRGSIVTIASEDGRPADFTITSNGATHHVDSVRFIDILINPDHWRPVERPEMEAAANHQVYGGG